MRACLIIAWQLRKGANEAQGSFLLSPPRGEIYLCKAHARCSRENDIICVLNTGAFFSLVTSLFAQENAVFAQRRILQIERSKEREKVVEPVVPGAWPFAVE